MVKFASITADLLARKGEARPWAYPAAEPERIADTVFADHGPSRDFAKPAEALHGRQAPSHPALEGGRKLTLRLSEADYECLGLIAAKRDVTRQALLREVLDHFLSEAAEEHRGRCGCIGSSCRR